MSALQNPAWNRVDEEAARWVVRKEGDTLEPEAAAQFDAWYAADPVHAQTYEALAASWRRLDQVSRLPIAHRKKPRSRAKALASACVLAGACLYAWTIFDEQNTVTSGIAVTQLTLPDGSLAILDAQTRLRLNFDEGQRQVKVEGGRAFFQVVPAGSGMSAFTVQAGQAQARALGTRYEVSFINEVGGVSVYEHAVQVQCLSCMTQQQAVLQPGDSAQISGGQMDVHVAKPSDALRVESAPAWTSGLLTFDDVSVRQAAQQLGDYTHRAIWIGSERAGSIRVSGLVQAARPVAALELLTSGYGLKIVELPGLIVIY